MTFAISLGNAGAGITSANGATPAVDAYGTACAALGTTGNQGVVLWTRIAQVGDTTGPWTFNMNVADNYALQIVETSNPSMTPYERCAGNVPSNSSVVATGGPPPSATLVAATITTATRTLDLVAYSPSTVGLSVTPNAGYTKSVFSSALTRYVTFDVETHATQAAGTISPSTVVTMPTATPTPAAAIVWAPSIHAGLTATFISPPTPTPTPSPGCCTNGVEWPASFTPYASTSIWNRQMTNQTNPTLLSGSDTIIANNMQSTDGQQLWTLYGDHPVYFTSTSDPIVHLNCTVYCANVPATAYVPANMQSYHNANGTPAGDAHVTIIQPDGTEIDTWKTVYAAPYTGSSTLSASTITPCGNFYTGTGLPPSGNISSNVGDTCLAGGLVRYSEAISGTINHALTLLVSCGNTTSGSQVYPATQPFDVACTGTTGPPNGSHFWLDLTDAQINALTLQGNAQDAVWQRAVLKALHHYGGYLTDSGGNLTSRSGEPNIVWENNYVQWLTFGVAQNSVPWVSYAIANSWSGPTSIAVGNTNYPAYTFADPWLPLASVGGWSGGHLHIVSSCYGAGTC